ncbi:MAG TPA: flavin reductase family protein [Elusimicrobiota bacterium]|nr:flavin reductase family protein [Elusimicrobiota bacterium]
MKTIDIEKLDLKPFHILNREWALLVAGKTKPNPMTVSWGGFGTLWNRPVVTVYVRPTRHTHTLLESHPEFTLNFLPASFRKALNTCGAQSGRDVDKWRETGLHPDGSSTVSVPRVREADLVFECRIIATLDVDPKKFLDRSLNDLYASNDHHRVYIGELVAALEK